MKDKKQKKDIIKIEKRYQYITHGGIQWSPWYIYTTTNPPTTTQHSIIDNSKLEYWQLKSVGLKNEYRMNHNGVITPIKVKQNIN